MFWHFDGEILIHPTDGTDKRFEAVSTDFWLPDENVSVIRQFIESQRDLILSHKYSPHQGAAPWGETYGEMMTRLNELQPPEAYWFGDLDRQTKAALTAYRHELINNVDSYFPSSDRRSELVAA